MIRFVAHADCTDVSEPYFFLGIFFSSLQNTWAIIQEKFESIWLLQ